MISSLKSLVYVLQHKYVEVAVDYLSVVNKCPKSTGISIDSSRNPLVCLPISELAMPFKIPHNHNLFYYF